MRSAHPPRIAAWILRHFGSSPNNAALIGDLNERFQRGRTVVWYWRQVAAAIVVSFFQEVWSHKLLIASAVLYGWSFWFYVSRFSFYLNLELFYAAVGRDWGETIPRLAVQLSELLLWGVLSGWLVARLDRRNHKAMVLAYAGFFAAIYSVDIAHDLLRGRGHPPILLLIVIIPITILAGGGVFSTHKKDGGSARDRAAAG